jgi:ParB-like chromosome segregation protein Spo0J
MPGERVIELSIDELLPPDFHPFQILDDPAMERLVKSVKEYGVREPAQTRL